MNVSSTWNELVDRQCVLGHGYVTETPFSQQCERFLDNLGRSSTCSSLLAVEFTMVYCHVVFNAPQINSYVFSEECK